jgi:YbgC/YbaW family acyl-CoA thioester hydrolase
MAVTFSRSVEYSMLDGANIAYYPRIYDLAHKFFEQCWLEMCQIKYPDLINTNRIGFPIVHAESDFIAPMRYGDEVIATIWIDNIGSKSLTWNYRFHNQNDELLWTSKQVTVCVDMDSMQPQPIPDYLITGLEKHLSEEIS